MALTTRLDDFINRLNDQDWGWWPFVRLRPPKHERITTGRLAVMSLVYGFVIGAVAIVLLARLGRASWSDSPRVVIASMLLFFGGWGAIFRPSWNRRAKRLAGDAGREDHGQ
jgi:hypothetical protein